MSEQWQYQMRVDLEGAFAEMARSDPGNPALKPLTDILARHRATMKSQFDAFAAYVAEAERQGIEAFPLYRWTRATLEDADKKARHLRTFALRVDGQEVYPEATADALEADLHPLVGGGLITALSRQDTNPATSMPVPEQFRS
jgi:hypothetical protein